MSLGEALFRHNVRFNTSNQVLQVIGINMVTPFLGILALRYGASSLEVGLLSSLPAAAAVLATLPASLWLRCFPRRHTASFLLEAGLRVLVGYAFFRLARAT